MRVKKIEIFGFKSFAQKTTIHFEPGVTAIVGPNGAGKSNIVDSIRWVLGEHNPRDVRAPRLEDVIFNGTDKRAPLSMAEVHLTIANEQGLLPIAFTEVTVARRVYRSGESEYSINQSPCRLKDIQELFLGTGLGGGTYAIIEQGHIDMVLSSKPEERRVPFEEASGIAKYLAKKQETVRRLEETEEHLLRIADIVSEVRRQVSALERAANRARQYKSQWDQLKQFEVRLAVDELTAGESRAKELEQQVQALTARRDSLEAEKQAHVVSLEASNALVSSTAQQLQALHTKAVGCTSGIDQHGSQLTLKTRWIEELTAQAQQLAQEEIQLRERLAQAAEQLARVSGGEGELATQHAAVAQQLAQVGGELAMLEAGFQDALAALETVKPQVFEAASDASHARNEVAQCSSQLQGLNAQRARVEEQGAQRAAYAADVQRRLEVAQKERDALAAQHEEIQRRIAATQQALDAATARRHELGGRLHQLRDQVASRRAEAKLMEDLWHRYDGFPETVKSLMGRSISGLIGPLVDLLQAKPGYEKVVEAALGPLADALVVQDREALARCREALAAEQLDGCRFLVLSDCPRSPAAAEQPSVGPGVTGAVKEFVRAEPSYQPLVDWVLNDSWIIDDIQRLLGEHSVPQGRLVSSRGDRWDRRSWRFGSARPAVHSRLGRKQRWDQARTQLGQLEQECRALESEAKLAEEHWQVCLAEQESAKGHLIHIAPALQKVQLHVDQLAREVERVTEERQACELDAQELTRQHDALRTAHSAAQESVCAAETRQQSLERSLAEAQAAQAAAAQRRQQLAITKAQIDATAQGFSERLEALRLRRQEVESDHAHLAQQLDARVRQKQEAIGRSTDLTAQMETHRQGKIQLEEERVRVEADVERVSQQLQDEEVKRDQILPHLLAAEQQLSALMRQIQEQTQQFSERTFRRSRLLERLRELYQIDEATLQAEQQGGASPLTDEQRTSMTEQVQKLRSKLEGMGPVSLGSVEEYDELKRRLEFLQTQQQDLTQAREDLKASITQINRTARTQFRETFERIRQEFQHYYTRLFDGGQADLILMDEEDVLECGIDIVARPPGKRLQSISLLSGGERALTAIALLFALFKVRPSPFCILDEIDAPLDEANVDRFTRVLEEFLALSQFILITHNKKTITKADSLYGVTMSEPGISQILSAKLTTSSASSTAPTPVAA